MFHCMLWHVIQAMLIFKFMLENVCQMFCSLKKDRNLRQITVNVDFLYISQNRNLPCDCVFCDNVDFQRSTFTISNYYIVIYDLSNSQLGYYGCDINYCEICL